MKNKALPLVESIAVPDIFVSGMASAEDLGGGCIRVTFYAVQRSCISGEKERVVVARFVLMGKTAVEISERVLLAVNGNVEDFGEEPEAMGLTH